MFSTYKKIGQKLKIIGILGIGIIGIVGLDHTFFEGTIQAAVRSHVVNTESSQFVDPKDITTPTNNAKDPMNTVLNPRQTIEEILTGQASIATLNSLLSYPQKTETGNTRNVTLLPITFYTESGEIGTYHPAYIDLEQTIPPDLQDIVATSEGTPEDNKTNIYTFLSKLLYRKIKGTNSGGSDWAAQLVERVHHSPGASPLHPSLSRYAIDTGLNYPETIAAFSSGLAPHEITLADIDEHSSIGPIREQFNELILGRLLAAHPEALHFYLSTLDMGRLEGSPIIGLAPAAEIFFEKNIEQLTTEEKYILTALIPQAQYIIQQCIDDNACNTIYHRENGLKNQAKLKVDNMLKRGKITQEKAVEIKNALDQYNFKKPSIPNKYSDQWLEEIDPHTKGVILELKNTPVEVLAKRGMIGSNGVKIYLEQQKEILSTKESHYPFDHRLSEFINGTMEMRNGIHVNPTMYQTIQLNEEAAYPELANGHTGLGVILITEDHETIASYDESLNSQLTNNIFTPGSSFKPFAIAFLFSEGFIQKGQIVNDKKGLYALGTEKMTVKNGTDDIGPMTIEESLANSRNTGIQEIFKEYIEKNGIEGWNRFQNYLERLGIFICNEKGEKITNPLDPKNPSYTPVLGTGIGAYINSVTGSPMEAYTRAFSALADDRPFESLTEKERYSLDYVGDVISNTGYDQYTENIRVWSEKSIYLLAAEYAKRAGLGTISTRIKTGTVEEPDGSISGVLAFVTVESEGKTVTVGVNIRDFNQQGHYVDLTNAYNEESTLNALPTALSIAIESLKWELE